ncbi:MAG TPA: hypothetical protein VNI54_01395 [Thermoanaerobaculia bacterium]|nr:hypothetical protein [Thermoanaerobaculia bacterium]
MTKIKALALLFFELALAGAAAAQTPAPTPQTIRFDECYRLLPCMVDVVTFVGGVSLHTDDPYTDTQGPMYHTSPYCTGNVCDPDILIKFATDVMDVKFSVANGYPLDRQTVVATSTTGARASVDLPKYTGKKMFDPHWRQMVMPAGSHRQILVQGTRWGRYCDNNNLCFNTFWDYNLDDFIFTKVPSDRRIVFGLRGIPGNNPFEKSLPRTDQLTATIPLGAQFFTRIEKKQGNAWVPILSSSQMTNEATKDLNAQDKNSLFRAHPLIAYNQAGLQDEKLFQAIHYGTATIVLRTSDPKVPTVTLNVTINAPSKLGDPTYKDPRDNSTQQNRYQWDAMIMDRAHRTGIPPQWIKAMIEKEAHFNTTAFRYEIRTRDWNWIQDPKHQYHHGKEPFVRYRMGDGADLCDPRNTANVPAGTCNSFKDLDDISPRAKYKIKDPITGNPRAIKPEDGVVTIRQLLDGGNGFSIGSNSTSSSAAPPAPRGRRRAVGFPDGTKVPAQTTIASSYGLLQLLWCDVVGTGFKQWPGTGNRLNPTFLFDTAENHKRGSGSLNIAPSYAAYKYDRVNADPIDPTYLAPGNFVSDLKEMLEAYNGGSDYPGLVEIRVPHYTPYPSTIVTAPLCEPQEFTSQTREAFLTPGGRTSLGVSIDADDVTYRWFSGSVGNVIAGATDMTLTVSAPGTYWAEATTECGPVLSDPIVVRNLPSCAAPSIAEQPVAQKTILQGATASFGAEVSGSNVRYQWYEGSPEGAATAPVGTFAAANATPLAGETGPSILVQPNETTTYFLYAYNACGSVLSRVVTVIVQPCVSASVGAQSVPTTITRGDSTVLSVTPQGTAPFTIQWYTGTPGAATAIDGANVATLPVSPNATTTYFATITNRCGSATSTPVQITVKEPCVAASIGAQSGPQTIARGDSTTLSITPGGSTPRNIQWYAGGVAITGANAETLPVTPNVTTTYHALVSNDCGTATSAPVTITVVETCVAPSIAGQSSSTTIPRGDSTTLVIQPAGSTPRTIHWYAGGVAITGANAETLPVTPNATTTYHAVVSNDCGTASSAPVTITVSDACVPASIGAQTSSTTITSGQSTTLSITTAGTAPRTVQWYAGTTPITGANAESLPVSPTSTTTYFVRVTNACGSVDSAPITITVQCAAPSIAQHPQGTSIVAGQSATLSVVASGATSYQWFAGSTPIAGATSFSLTVTPASTTSYSVVVSNSCGSSTSNVATVTVTSCNKPSITQPPQSTSIVAGQSATLSVVASGATSYQWFAGLTPIAGATSSSLTVTPASTTSYFVVVSNSCGSTTSNTATVTVTSCSKPSITQPPQSRTIAAGESVTLSVAASNATGYQWFTSDGAAIPGATSPSLTVDPIATTSYYAVVSNSCGSTTSSTATVTVICNLPTISQQPQDAYILSGETATLSFSAFGAASYEWYTADGTLVGSWASVTVSPSETTTYYGVAYNICGSRMTNLVTVTVDPCVKAFISEQPDDVTIEGGESATLTVYAGGDEPLAYRWHYSTGGVVGTGQSITVSPETTTSYYVIVENACQIVSSRFVTVTVVCNPLTVTAQPQDHEFTESWQSASLHFGVSGTDPAITWYRDGFEIGSGASIPIYPSTSTHTYHAVATNACGSVTSNAVVIEKLCNAPQATIVAVSEPVIAPGGSSVLQVNTSESVFLYWTLYEQAAGSGPVAISSGSGLGVPNATVMPSVSSDYWFEVKNDCGTTNSNVVHIQVQ